MGKVKRAENGRIEFTCLGCGEIHSLPVDGEKHPVWKFNGNFDKPTLSPSILYTSGHYCAHAKKDDCWCNYKERTGKEPPFQCVRCHSFVTDGKIQFLTDSTHKLAGQTVEMEDIE